MIKHSQTIEIFLPETYSLIPYILFINLQTVIWFHCEQYLFKSIILVLCKEYFAVNFVFFITYHNLFQKQNILHLSSEYFLFYIIMLIILTYLHLFINDHSSSTKLELILTTFSHLQYLLKSTPIISFLHLICIFTFLIIS